ncbi:helix-turn-helix domain-containing protein [Kitasatospora sp. NPDC006786]|uniref:helix-turn-helix domain-containing protein n=1 Tax=unclassified Kitasatospora TaxID=2633591 RepID=UPI0033C35FED
MRRPVGLEMVRDGWFGVVLRARQGRGSGEGAVVRRLARARKAPADLVLRARMIELSRAGSRVPAIAAKLMCSQKTVRCWIHRFNRDRLEGLEGLGGQGRRRRITEAERSAGCGPALRLTISRRRLLTLANGCTGQPLD